MQLTDSARDSAEKAAALPLLSTANRWSTSAMLVVSSREMVTLLSSSSRRLTPCSAADATSFAAPSTFETEKVRSFVGIEQRSGDRFPSLLIHRAAGHLFCCWPAPGAFACDVPCRLGSPWGTSAHAISASTALLRRAYIARAGVMHAQAHLDADGVEEGLLRQLVAQLLRTCTFAKAA